MQTAIYLYKLLIQIVLSIAFNGPSVYAARFRMNVDHYVLFRVLPVALQVHPGTSPLVLPSHLPVLLSPPLAAFKYSPITPGVFFAYKRILSPSASMLLSSGVLPFACRDISDTRFCSLTGRSSNVQRSCMSIPRLHDVDRSYKSHRSYKSSCCRIHPAPRLASFFAGIPVREVPRVHHAVRCGEFVSGLGFSSALWPPPLDDALFVLSMCSGLMVA